MEAGAAHARAAASTEAADIAAAALKTYEIEIAQP